MKNFLRKIIPRFILNWYHFLEAVLANIIYFSPSRKLIVIGVTGTNGKTTVVQLITKILEGAGHKVGMISTISFKIGEKEWVNKTKMTTLPVFKTMRFLSKMRKAGCRYGVIEVSSHSLDQHRVWGIHFDVAVLTNISREHLDYHKTMEKYRAAKVKLFKKLAISKRKKGVSKVIVLNAEDENFENFLELEADRKYCFGIEFKHPDHRFNAIIAGNVEYRKDGTKFKIYAPIGSIDISTKLLGRFNIENILAASAVTLSQGISLGIIKKVIEKIENIPGRLEKIDEGQDFTVFIDYAVTPDSLRKLYGTVRLMGARRILAVFGACGERDRGKRPIMGQIVGKEADLVVVTNEDPYNEDPEKIIDEVSAGVREAGKIEDKNFWRIKDRREAIEFILKKARPGDIVLITGKGAEETMAIGDKRVPWSDRKVVREILKALKK